MSPDYPEETVGGFPRPPRSVTDGRQRHITFRRLTDLEPLVEMYVDFPAEERAQGIPPGGEPAIRDWLDIVTGTNCLNVVGRHESTTVGHAMLVAEDNGNHELAIFVRPDYQGAGIGTELLETTLGAAAAAGFECIWLSVERWNRAAIGLYEKVGFQRVESRSFEMEMRIRLETE